jgi:hypothetical protein
VYLRAPRPRRCGDNDYSVAERIKFSGHSNPNIFFNSYMSQLSAVDGQASFLGEELCRDHIGDF